MNRFWDPENQYIDGFLKSYQYWTLELSFRQHTLGCFIIFANKPVERISDLNNEELAELKTVMLDIESALSDAKEFSPDRFNYLQLGNALHNLHFHGVPRYEQKKTGMELYGKIKAGDIHQFGQRSGRQKN